jgi:chromosome partitioning protein
VVNIAAVMADWGYRVLVIDVDPQSNATTSLGFDARDLEISIYEVLLGELGTQDVICSTAWQDLDLLPSHPSVAGVAVELNEFSPAQRVRRLQVALTELGTTYDYILIDSPPSLGVLTVNALTASDAVIVPVQCEYLALEGLSQLMRTIGLVRRGLNPSLSLRGLVMTMSDARTTLSREVINEVKRHYTDQVFDTVIPRSVRLSEAPSYGEPGVLYAPRSSGAVAYLSLTRELLLGDGCEVAWQPE